MEKLSSSITPFTKFVLPGGFLAAWPAWLYQIQDSRFGYLPAISWTVACVFLIWWTAPIKKVALGEDHFSSAIISGKFEYQRAGSSRLRKTREIERQTLLCFLI